MNGPVLTNQNRKSPEHLVLGIDYGTTNIGLALGGHGICTPLKVLNAKELQSAIKEINKVVYENKIKTVVLGLPLTADGKETRKSLEVRRFAKQLRISLKLPIEFVNEILTTRESLERSIDLGFSEKSRRKIDHLSAAIILKNYFDEIDE